MVGSLSVIVGGMRTRSEGAGSHQGQPNMSPWVVSAMILKLAPSDEEFCQQGGCVVPKYENNCSSHLHRNGSNRQFCSRDILYVPAERRPVWTLTCQTKKACSVLTVTVVKTA